jgi:5-methylcytosine-specific restriction enzyme A
MPLYQFTVGSRYTRSQVADRIELEAEKAKGDWLTGYTVQQGAFFIFCNVGAAGRTGHDYPNYFEGERLRWTGRTASRLDQPRSRQLLSGGHEVYVFFRSGDRDPFEFAGLGTAVEQEDGPPIRVLWSFENDAAPRPTDSPGEIRGETFREGAMAQVTVNAYERNPAARRACIDHYGCFCQVCGFNFEKVWGELGKDFIHVHHLKEISSVGQEYEVDPINDLIPVCPNCHAMLHRRRPATPVMDLKNLLHS